MKLETGNQDVAVHGDFETTDFAIGDIAFIVDMFADKVYSHKERAIIRELSCNAHDSHVMAGTTGVPFEVHLPTTLESWFSIRDYGTGLSDEDVRNIFAGIGISTKRDSNEVIGCFGIGSLSPYALTDSFNVKSYMNGVVRHYNCYRDDNRKPVVALLTEMETDEPNGLEVSLTVDGRVSAFEDDAVHVFKYWEGTTPDINNDYVVEQIKRKQNFILQTDNFGFKKGYNDLYAVMGNIAYRIDREFFNDSFDLYGIGGYIKFDLGELEFDTARENLADTPKVRDAINSKFQQIKVEIRDIAIQQIEAEPTAFKQAYKADQLNTGSIGKLIGDLTDYELPKSDTPITYWNRNYRATNKSNTERLPLGERVRYYRWKDRMQTRIRSWLKDNDSITMVLLTDDQLHLVEGETLHDLDDLPKVHRAGTSGGGCKLKTYKFNPPASRYAEKKDYWDATTLELDGDEIVYVEIQRWEPINSGNRCLKNKLELLQEAGISVGVVGLKSVFMRGKTFRDGIQSGQFISLQDFAKRELEKIKPESKQSFDGEEFNFLKTLNTKIDCEELKCFDIKVERSKIERACREFMVDIPKDESIQRDIDNFLNKYPMLRFIEDYCYIPSLSENKLQRIADYIGGTIK
mgnify:CR=1 FL=1